MSEKKPKDALAGNPAKRGHGNVWEPTQEQKDAAKYLAAVGATEEQVAMHLGVCRDTVRARLTEELRYGREIADLGLVGKLYRKAMGSGIHSNDGDTACLIFLCKTRLGMWDRPPALPPMHPNDSLQNVREELSVSVTYRYSSNDPRALAPPPADRLPLQIEAQATKAD
jgi:hypothetical protein